MKGIMTVTRTMRMQVTKYNDENEVNEYNYDKEYNYEKEGLLPCNLRMIAGVLDKEQEKTNKMRVSE